MAYAYICRFQIVEYLCELRSPSGEFVVPVEEQAAAHELLGASLYDRLSPVFIS